MTVLNDLEAQVLEVKQKALQRRKREERDRAVVDKMVKIAREKDEKGKAGGKRGAQDVGPFGGDGQDDGQDDGKGSGRTRGTKRGGGVIKNAAKRMMG